MDESELAAKIDHTVLGPETAFDDVRAVLDEAAEYGMNACIPPCYVAEAAEYARSAGDAAERSSASNQTKSDDAASSERAGGRADVTLATVVGFPHGQHATDAKSEEASIAYDDGADELDMVINVGRLKAGDREAVREDIEEVVAAVPIPVKVIIETALLTDDEKRAACEAAKEADAAFVKTSTGFADGGAEVGDVELMSEYLPVKASGGIGDYEKARAMLDAGAERIGASSGVEILEDFRRNDRT